MDWIVLTNLILTYGIPLAERIWQKASSGNPPTQADWDELKAIAAQTAQSQLAAAAARAGLPADDPRVKALLDLAKPAVLPPPPPPAGFPLP
jgi:hypothetical protein